MRKLPARTGLNLSAFIDSAEVVRPTSPSVGMRLHMAQGGRSAAAWLVWECRKRFARSGEVDFTIPDGIATPSWLRVAVEYLRVLRGARWGVVVFRRGPDEARERVYRVSWRDHGYYRAWREVGGPPDGEDGPPSWLAGQGGPRS